jgi:hypothetical protein
MYSVDIYSRVRRACLKDGMSAIFRHLHQNLLMHSCRENSASASP